MLTSLSLAYSPALLTRPIELCVWGWECVCVCVCEGVGLVLL